jgi:alpha-pyrone synthase
MDTDNLIANAIFADGAAAVLVEAAFTPKKHLSLEAFHCNLLPQAKTQMAWHIGDFGFEMVLSAYVPDTIGAGIQQFMQQLMAQTNLATTAIDFYAIHPGGAKILEACEQALKLSKSDNRYAYHVLRNYGNMSSATILFVLKALWDDLKTEDHDKTIFSCAFGPGLTLESMLLRTYLG